VNKENKIVGIGYNGMPNNCSDDELPWSRTNKDKLKTKYPYGECHRFIQEMVIPIELFSLCSYSVCKILLIVETILP